MERVKQATREAAKDVKAQTEKIKKATSKAKDPVNMSPQTEHAMGQWKKSVDLIKSSFKNLANGNIFKGISQQVKGYTKEYRTLEEDIKKVSNQLDKLRQKEERDRKSVV